MLLLLSYVTYLIYVVIHIFRAEGIACRHWWLKGQWLFLADSAIVQLELKDFFVGLLHINGTGQVVNSFIILFKVADHSTFNAVIFTHIVNSPTMGTEIIQAYSFFVQPYLCSLLALEVFLGLRVNENEVPSVFAKDDGGNHVLVELTGLVQCHSYLPC